MRIPEQLEELAYIESDDIAMPSSFTGPVEGVTLCINPMATDEGLHGEFIEAWPTNEADPWHMNIQSYFVPGGFRVVAQAPYNEDDSDYENGRLARPESATDQRAQFTRENDGVIVAQERHLIISGIAKSYFDYVRATYEPDA